LLAGLTILLIGFGLIVAGSAAQSGASAGGAIFIGPFPIVFGAGPNGSSLALISVVIGAVMVALVMLWGWRMSGRRDGSPE
jgi:uncharacterized membrane protein